MLRRLLNARIGNAVVILCTAVVVAALAVIQYRWNQEASDATGVRLADALQLSMINWHLDLFRNLSEVALAMTVPAEDRPHEFAVRLGEWRSRARYPDLLANVVRVRRVGPAGFEVQQLVPETVTIDRAKWSKAVAHVVEHLEQPNTLRPTAQPPARPLTESFYIVGAALQSWQFDPEALALVRSSSESNTEWLMVELDEQVLRRQILPGLAQRYFQGTDGLDYEVAVTTGAAKRQVIYTSDAGFGPDEVRDADGRMDLFGRATGGSAIRIFHRTSLNHGPTAAVGVSWFPPLGGGSVDGDWQLIVRHRRDGSLSSFVEHMRQRGLAVSFAALFLLVLSLSMLLVTTIRAQRLARLQMDFVTAVSHELRTPLTIIGSAADNIAHGVPDTPDRMREYGGVIGHEVGQLSGLVERILRFAATRDGRQQYVLESLNAADIVENVLASAGGLIRAAHFTVECDTDPSLPPVVGDRLAVSQCLENLVTNALKYGNDARWLKLRTTLAADNSAVEISVSDRGIGIAAGELPHIFEPFYRSRSVRLAQISGTGLGLAVARQIAQAMGGTITVDSELDRGSTFTLRLPLYEETVTASSIAPRPLIQPKTVSDQT